MARVQQSLQPVRPRNDGVQEAFAALYDRYEARIYAFLYRVTGDTRAAADLTRETFLRAYQALDHLSAGSGVEMDLNAWLHGIAAATHMNACRRGRGWALWGGVHRRPTADPMQSALERMVPRLHLALALRDYAGLSCAEVGTALGISAEAARMLLFEAREEARSYLRREQPFAEPADGEP